MKRFLFATMPFDGHFKPLTGIAVRLMELGHDVRWYAGPTYAAALGAHGIPHLPFRRANEVNGENIGDLFPERARLSGPKLIAFEFENVFVANCEAHFRDIEEIRREFPFDVLIADEGLYAIKLVAERLGVPVHAVGVGPLMFNSPHVPPNFFGLKPARSPLGRIRDHVVHTMVNSTMKPGAKRFNELLEAEGLQPLAAPRDFFDIPADVSTTFWQSGVPGFEWPRPDLPDNVRFVGPLLPHRAATAFGLADRLGGVDSVIVVSQGTVDNKDPEKLLAPALRALAGTDHVVIAATGGCNTEQLRERFPAENVMIEDFVDFATIFERTRLFICNGGYGSVMLALSNGVPVLSAGKREGKNDINARIDHFGVGIDLRTERPTATKIAKGVARILADPEYVERAARLRDELRSYEPIDLIAGELAGASFSSRDEAQPAR